MNSPDKSAQGKKEMKLAVVGSGGVGKTAITVRFVTSHFYDQGYNPTIEDSYRKQVVVNDEAVTLEILDTAGQEEYAVMADQWYRYAEGFLLVYSITDRQSFINLNKMHKDILRVKERGKKDVACIVVSQKCDLAHERAVGQLEGRDLARELHAPFIETSAAEGVNVDAAFRELVKLVRRKKQRDAKVQSLISRPLSGPMGTELIMERMNMAADRILAGPIAAGNMQGVPSSRQPPHSSSRGRNHPSGADRRHDDPDPPSASDGLPVGLRTPDLPQYSSTRSAGNDVMGTLERQQLSRPGDPGHGGGGGSRGQSPLRKEGAHGAGRDEPGGKGGYGKGRETEKVESVKGECCVVM